MKYKNYLTDDQIDELIEEEKQELSYKVIPTDKEKIKAICNHRSKDGDSDAIIVEDDGWARCLICGRRFKILNDDVSTEGVKISIQSIIDIIETIKYIGIDLPADTAKEIYTIEAYLDYIPNLYEWAKKDFEKYATMEKINPYNMNRCPDNYCNPYYPYTLNRFTQSFGK